MRIILLLLFFFIFSIINAQNKIQKSQYIEKNIESCRIPANDSVSVINIHENFHGNDIEIILKTENTIMNECVKKVITPEMMAKFNTSQNPIIDINKHHIDDINIIDFKNLVLNKISSIKKEKYTILAIELYNVSFTTVGSTYIYLSFKIDTKGKVLKTKILESKSSIKIDKLLTI